MYLFSHRPEEPLFPPCEGVCHTEEVQFVFQIDELLVGPGEVALARRIGAFWTNFAATGNPTPVGTPGIAWPAHTNAATGDLYLNLDLNPNMVVISGLKSNLCDLWTVFP